MYRLSFGSFLRFIDVLPSIFMLLSKKRAEAVKEFLIQFGIDENRIVVDFSGETKPISTNDTEEERSHNRRVDMVVVH